MAERQEKLRFGITMATLMSSIIKLFQISQFFKRQSEPTR